MGESPNCSPGLSAVKAGYPPRATPSDGRRVEPAGPVHRRPGLTLYRLVAKEALTPTFLALFGLTTVVLTQNLLELSDLFVNRGLIAYLRSEDELAAVIGHEIGHVVGAHAKRSNTTARIGNIALALAWFAIKTKCSHVL